MTASAVTPMFRREPVAVAALRDTDRRSEPVAIAALRDTDRRSEPVAIAAPRDTDRRSDPVAVAAPRDTDRRSEPVAIAALRDPDRRCEPIAIAPQHEPLRMRSATLARVAIRGGMRVRSAIVARVAVLAGMRACAAMAARVAILAGILASACTDTLEVPGAPVGCDPLGGKIDGTFLDAFAKPVSFGAITANLSEPDQVVLTDNVLSLVIGVGPPPRTFQLIFPGRPVNAVIGKLILDEDQTCYAGRFVATFQYHGDINGWFAVP